MPGDGFFPSVLAFAVPPWAADRPGDEFPGAQVSRVSARQRGAAPAAVHVPRDKSGLPE